jgi:hypothetical protein
VVRFRFYYCIVCHFYLHAVLVLPSVTPRPPVFLGYLDRLQFIALLYAVQEKRRLKSMETHPECTFAPKISPSTARPTSAAETRDRGDRFLRLYEQAKVGSRRLVLLCTVAVPAGPSLAHAIALGMRGFHTTVFTTG